MLHLISLIMFKGGKSGCCYVLSSQAGSRPHSPTVLCKEHVQDARVQPTRAQRDGAATWEPAQGAGTAQGQPDHLPGTPLPYGLAEGSRGHNKMASVCIFFRQMGSLGNLNTRSLSEDKISLII